MAIADFLVTKGELFLKHIESKKITVPTDSLKKLLCFVTFGTPYDLSLRINENLKSSRKLSVIKKKSRLVSYAQIISVDIDGHIHRKTNIAMRFNGSGREITKEIRTSYLFTLAKDSLPQKFRLSKKEFWDILPRPSTFATFIDAWQIKFIRVIYMKKINRSMTEFIEMLENKKNGS
jgi:hypothetical protein